MDSFTAPLPLFPKELSWLAFNERVLQEAADPSTPVIERMRFLGIFSNNMDEFFKVRVADIKRRILLSQLNKVADDQSEQLLQSVQEKVLKLNQQFNHIYADVRFALLRQHIQLVQVDELSNNQKTWIQTHFKNKVLRHLAPILVDEQADLNSVLSDNTHYLMVEMQKDQKLQYAAIEVPCKTLSRFIVIPHEPREKHQKIMLLDDVIEYNLEVLFKDFFEFDTVRAFSLKLTRDAEYNLTDQIDDGLMAKMSKSLKQRLNADPVRFVYDSNMTDSMLKMLKRKLKLSSYEALIPGARYRNFRDFISFPNLGRQHLEHPKLPAIAHPSFANASNGFDAISQQDILLYYPYHKFHHFTELVRQAAYDPNVTSIKLNIYRVARNSRVIASLLNAVRNGKNVTVVVELRARFDEENNISWAKTMSDAGIKVVFGVSSLKVHAKLCLIKRNEKGRIVKYAHIGTGNFNENTAKIYTDFSLFTVHNDIADEVDNVFELIEHPYKNFQFKHLLVSPMNCRSELVRLIDREIEHANLRRKAQIILKCNNLVDEQMIAKLYQASQAGVQVQLLIRGMCCLIPGLKGQSDNIKIISVVDRYLEHARVYYFHNHGEQDLYISSADWMARNIDERVEVGVRVYSPEIKQQILEILAIQWQDRSKAREIDSEQVNRYVKRGNKKKIRSQIAIYDYLRACNLPASLE